MKNRTGTVLALALLAFAMSATQTRAQSIYTPYAFTNFAGLPGVYGTNDGTGSAARQKANCYQFDTVPDYTDTQPIPAAGQSALWQYNAIYHQGDDRVGQWSDVVSIPVAG